MMIVHGTLKVFIQKICPKGYASYMTDYEQFLEEYAVASNLKYESFYHLENSWENYDLIAKIIDERFIQWQLFQER